MDTGTPRGKRNRSGTQKAAPVDGTGNPANGDIGRLLERLDRLDARLERIERIQEDDFLLIMKFVTIRTIGILAALVEQGSAPPRIVAEAQEMVSETYQKIREARDLEELRRLDAELSSRLRGVIGVFRPT